MNSTRKRSLDAGESSLSVEVGPSDAKEAKIAPIFASRELHGSWKIIERELMIFTPNNINHQKKIAGFDLDGTLIKTKSGAVFPKDANDWQLWNSTIVKKLSTAHEQGFKICIFSNQKGLLKVLQNDKKGKRNVGTGDFQGKIRRICTALSIPIQVFISLGTYNYRKPFSGMWDRLVNRENGGIEVDIHESFYVGDAAGRKSSQNFVKADHSCVDRLFALNCSLRFYTPEQFFLGRKDEESYTLPSFNPSEFMETSKAHLDTNRSDSILNCLASKFPGSHLPELLVLVGPPASGKSTFATKLKQALDGKAEYAIISQDDLGTKIACLKKAREMLLSKTSVIVDNTNRNKLTRLEYIDLAQNLSVPCRSLSFKCSQGHAMHNNRFRLILGSDENHKDVADVAIRKYFSTYEVPEVSEGFEDVIDVEFIPEFGSEKERSVYSQFLLEK